MAIAEPVVGSITMIVCMLEGVKASDGVTVPLENLLVPARGGESGSSKSRRTFESKNLLGNSKAGHYDWLQ